MPILTAVSHADLVADVRTLATRIADGGAMPAAIVGIGRGGLVPAVYLSHATGVAMLSLDWSDRDAGGAEAALAALAARTQAGDPLLLVDDINDSGRTILALRAALAAAGADATRIRYATLIDNVRSIARVDHAARTIDRTVDKDWFVFPWEAMAPRAAIVADAAAVPDRTA